MRRSQIFFRVRVGVLVTALCIVVAWAVRDVQSRRARNDWDHTLTVAVVLLRLAPIDDAPLAAFRARRPAVEARLAAELQRHRPGAVRPFVFVVAGPLDVPAPPPTSEGDGFLDLARRAAASLRYFRAVDAAVGLDPGAFDARIYVSVRPAKAGVAAYVEGMSELGGRVGTVAVELDTAMVDVAWIVTAHELFHTLGATDKYDVAGHATVPDGLVEPHRVPLYPQPFVEIMARNRPVSATEERVPDRLDELGVGEATAREIGWTSAAK